MRFLNELHEGDRISGIYLCKQKQPAVTKNGKPYGILKIEGNKPKLEAMGILQLNKYEDHYLRLRKIFERVLALIDQYHPDELAIEAPFFGDNYVH